MKLGRLNHIGVVRPPSILVAPAQAGAHHVCPSKPQGEIGSSLRWSDGGFGI
ncbi:MAG: hypothetical protein ABI668_03825 [Sphingorhabdus sp.]